MQLPIAFKEDNQICNHQLYYGDNLSILQEYVPDESVNLIYIDPPFNTGKLQKRTEIKVEPDAQGDRVGFQGKTYRTRKVKTIYYTDKFESLDDYLQFLCPRFEEAYRVLHPHGSFFLHIDYRAVHYCKVILDEIFGRDSLLVGKAKAARGKTPTDVWWHTIVSTNGSEKTGYPTQKPLGVLNRIVKVHSEPGDTLLDFFAGSGTLGEAAALHSRSSILIDSNIPAIEVIMERLAFYGIELVNIDYKVLMD